MIVQTLFKEPQTCRSESLPTPAYSVPAPISHEALALRQENSDRVQPLSGEWKFQPLSGDHDLSSLLQSLPQETPVPCQSAPCGVYLHAFHYHKDKKAPKAFLGFESGDIHFQLWLNGHYLGCIESAPSGFELDVTDKIVEGGNILAVLAPAGFSPEASPAFRSAYLLKRPQQHICDYFVTSRITGAEADVQVWISFAEGSIPLSVKLMNADNRIVAKGYVRHVPNSGTSFTHQAVLHVKKPHLWNPEAPYLYTLLLESSCEVITGHVAIREVRIDNSTLYLNGRSINFPKTSIPRSDSAT